jgi:hypothetical protein
MLVTIHVLVLRPKKGFKRLPRSPDTVASALLYSASQGGLMERERLLDRVKDIKGIDTEQQKETISWLG